MTIYNEKIMWEYGQFYINDAQELDYYSLYDGNEYNGYDLYTHGMFLEVEDSDIFYVQASIYFNEIPQTSLIPLVQHLIQVPSGRLEFFAPTTQPSFVLPIKSSQVLVTVYRVENLEWIIQIQETEPNT